MKRSLIAAAAAAATLAPATYAPLHLEWSSADTGRRWSLTFQLEPTAQIEFKGDAPKLEEVVRVLATCGLPAVMAEIVLVVARTAIPKGYVL